MSTPTRVRIAVVGGGITGLAAAHRLHEVAPHVELRLFEAADRLGGVLATERRDGFLFERSADMFTTREPWAIDLCQRTGFADQLIPTNAAQRQSFVVRAGRLQPIPQGFTLMSPARIWPVVTTPILSLRGKLRLACEYVTPRRRDTSDESLASFVTRRFGREAFERLVQPLIGGIYTADPEKLSMAATMPQFVEMERRYGSLIRGMRKASRQRPDERESSGARYGMFVTPRDGLSSFVAHLQGRLPPESIRLRAAINRVFRDEAGRWRLAGAADEAFDGVLLAVPAPHAAMLLADAAPDLSALLSRIEHASVAIAVGAFRLDQFARLPNGFGVVAPLIERRRLLSISFSSIKFAGRAPEGHVFVRAFLGGACQPELLDLSDDEVLRATREELGDLFGLQGPPLFSEVIRWRNKMPQYHVGHLDRVAAIERLTADSPGLELAGNAYRGVGIPFCIRSGEQAAERLLRRVTNR